MYDLDFGGVGCGFGFVGLFYEGGVKVGGVVFGEDFVFGYCGGGGGGLIGGGLLGCEWFLVRGCEEGF